MKTNDEIQVLLDTAHRDADLPEDVEFSCRDYYPRIYGPPDNTRVNIMWYCERDGKEYGQIYSVPRNGINTGIKELVASVSSFLERTK